MATTIDTYIDPLGIDMNDFYLMSEEERMAVYEQAIEDGVSEEELLEIMNYLNEELSVQIAELENIIDSGDSSVEEVARAEFSLEGLEAMQLIADEFSSDFGDAQTDLEAHNVETTEDYTVDAGSEVSAGEEFVIDCTGATEDTGSADWAEDEHPDWLDTDGDQVGDLDPDQYNNETGAAGSDGYADEDFNEDGVITEADMERDGTSSDTQTITITVESTDTVTVSSYDAETGTVRFAITKEDGTVYYVTIQSEAGALPNINFTSSAALHTDDYSSLDEALTGRIYTSDTGSYSLLHYIDPSAESADNDYYTLVQMSDQTDNTYTESISATDFEQGRDYEIYCNSGTSDTISLDFPDSAELDFSTDGDGNLIITATYNGQTVTVTIHGFTVNEYTEKVDQLFITGGTIDSDDYTALSSIPFDYVDSSNTSSLLAWNDADSPFYYEDESIYDYFTTGDGADSGSTEEPEAEETYDV